MTKKTKATSGRDGWLNLRESGNPYFTDYIDATHIGIYERPRKSGDRIRVIKVFPATDDYIQQAEDFCDYGARHYQDLDPMSAKNQQKKIAQWQKRADEYAAKMKAQRSF